MKPKIYDCFTFFNELDLLEIRLNILNDYVDYFVIVESTVTFTSKPKELYFENNKEIFSKFKDKIIHVIINDTPNNFYNIEYKVIPTNQYEINRNKILKHVDTSTGWGRHETQWGVETYQRECILQGLNNLNDNDIIIISDLDEIPNPNKINGIKENFNINNVYNLKQKMYCYYLNIFKEDNWSGPKICSYNLLKNTSINLLRQNKFTNNIIENGGWHFSFMGGKDKIKEKLEAYSHQEFNNEYYKNAIENNMTTNQDPFFRGTMKQVQIDNTYPEYIINNQDKYKHLIKF